MRNISIKSVLVLLLIGILISCSDDKKSSTEPEGNGDNDQSLVGTWKLTKILAPIATTPQAVGLDLTANFAADGTLQFTTVDADGTTIDGGTWSSSDGVLTITIEGEDPAASPYTVVGNIATISAFPVDFQGSVLLASLEFTKQ
jgi:hypothetical protein